MVFFAFWSPALRAASQLLTKYSLKSVPKTIIYDRLPSLSYPFSGLYARSKNRPIQYQDFIKSEAARRRYWARNFVGWPRFGFHAPNATHHALAAWERDSRMHWLITQNVDALHFKAGSQRVTELHGSAHRVVCLKCHHVVDREEVGACCCCC